MKSMKNLLKSTDIFLWKSPYTYIFFTIAYLHSQLWAIQDHIDVVDMEMIRELQCGSWTMETPFSFSASLCMYEERLVIFTSNIGNVRRRETLLPLGNSRYTTAAICTVYSKQYELDIGKKSMATGKITYLRKNIFLRLPDVGNHFVFFFDRKMYSLRMFYMK